MAVLGDIVRDLLPTLGVTALFAIVIWSIVRADAAERRARARPPESVASVDSTDAESAAADSRAASRQGSGSSREPTDSSAVRREGDRHRQADA